MKFSTSALNACFAAFALLASTSSAYTPSTPNVTPVTQSNALDNSADVAMSQYEAALKAAFEQAATSAVPSQPEQVVVPETTAAPAFEPANAAPTMDAPVVTAPVLDQYEAALKAALESSRVEDTAAAASAPPAIVFNEASPDPASFEEAAQSTAAAAAAQQPDWDDISKVINSKIEKAESKIGAPLTAAAKGEIVGTVLAGSAVLGTAAINSPLLMGAALGYASTHVLGGKRGEALTKASKDAILNAVTFTQHQLEQEHGDISKASARIMEHIQHEALDRAKEVQQAASHQAHQISNELSNAPVQLVKEGKKLVSSGEFKQMPNRTFKAVQAFIGSEEVKRARESVVKSIKDGLESEELKAVKDRATRSLKDI